MKIKIAIDCRHVQFYREGITRSTIHLISSLKNEFEFHALLSDPKIPVPELDQFSEVTRHYLGPSWSKLDWFWENYSLVKLLSSLKPDIYHAPCTMGLPLKKIPGIRYAVTVHDLILQNFPSSYPFLGRLKWYVGIRVDVWRADGIITVSHFTKGLLCKQYDFSPENVHVVPHSIATSFTDRRKEKKTINAVRSRFGLESDYLIYHGGFKPYKNVAKVVESYDAYRRSGERRLKLCLVGNINEVFKRHVGPGMDRSPFKSDIVTTGYVTDIDLSYLLSGAQCFLYLSKMEGFGFAPLEAMACGLTVICSKNSSMVETLSDNVQWVEDGETPDEIAKMISMIISNKPFADNLIEKGLINALRYNNHQYMEDMKSAYETIARKKYIDLPIWKIKRNCKI
jgi:glycosyltransferase involved in cell wall biosynthesis